MNKSMEQWNVDIVNKAIQEVNDTYQNSLMSIEPSYEIKRKAIKKEFFRRFGEAEILSGFKVKSSTSEFVGKSQEKEIYLFKYVLEKGFVFKSSQELWVIQFNDGPLDAEELKQGIAKADNKFDTLKVARRLSPTLVETLSFNEESGIVLYNEIFTYKQPE